MHPRWIRAFAIVTFAVVGGAWATYELLTWGAGAALARLDLIETNSRAEFRLFAGFVGVGAGIAAGVILHWLERRRLMREYEQCIPPARAIDRG